MQLEVQGHVLPFWKPPINISKEPDCHGSWVFQHSNHLPGHAEKQYTCLKTNAQDCIYPLGSCQSGNDAPMPEAYYNPMAQASVTKNQTEKCVDN